MNEIPTRRFLVLRLEGRLYSMILPHSDGYVSQEDAEQVALELSERYPQHQFVVVGRLACYGVVAESRRTS